MDQADFQIAKPHLKQVAHQLDQILKCPQLQELRKTLEALSHELGDRYSVELSCVIEVCDEERERAIPLLDTGLTMACGCRPYRTRNDCTPHRYIVDGSIQVVPHDRCPACWGEWDFKWEHRQCPQCGVRLGVNCKVLLDSDVCPHCEHGKVTSTNPQCGKCGFVVDPSLATWG